MLGVSGLRGTVGGSLTPQTLVRFACAIAAYLKQTAPVNGSHHVVVFGRDTRPSGGFVRDAVACALTASGIELIDLGIVTTPSTAMMVTRLNADAGVVATASHNPIEWNGVKLLDRRGIAPPPTEVRKIIDLFNQEATRFEPVEKVFPAQSNTETNAYHIQKVLALVDVLGIASRRYKVVLDSINGAGAVAGATLLSKLGCTVVQINGEPHGRFAHTPEPIEANLTQLADEVRRHKADVGFAQDPDADRLAVVDDTGRFIGEEYTLALAAKFIFAKKPGVLAAANLSTSRMIDDLAAASGGRVIRTPVGEANVVEGMLTHGCSFGGEGNGGVIEPRVVSGRDSLISMAYVLGLIAREGRRLSEVVASIPRYEIVKTKFECPKDKAALAVEAVKASFASDKIDTQDGIRIDFADGAWVHARSSNTEPIMRIIAEAKDRPAADARIAQVQAVVDRAIR
jgi:phosphomannomutase